MKDKMYGADMNESRVEIDVGLSFNVKFSVQWIGYFESLDNVEVLEVSVK